jgi:cyclophilin family peptidyl-prolyl cis-trans isomerase/HEAT repeat protein
METTQKLRYMQKLLLLWMTPLLLALFGCKPAEEEQAGEVQFNLADPVVREIYAHQDHQRADSLLVWFKHENPTYRFAAAMAFASIKDSAALGYLTGLLTDPQDEVRAAAAYAIGQIGASPGELSLIDAFERADTIGLFIKSNRAILEAIGKCGSLRTLQQLATVSTYRPADTLLVEGQALGIYRFALRNIIAKEGTARMLELASDPMYSDRIRLVAANYLARARNITIDSLDAQALIGRLAVEPNPNIRMALALAMEKVKSRSAMDSLISLWQKEADYRVRCNIARALGAFEYEAVQATAILGLKDSNAHVAFSAARFFTENGIPQDALFYWRLAKDSLHWNAQLQMYAAAQRHLPPNQEETRNKINWEVRQRFLNGVSAAQKVAALRALAEYPWNFRFIQRETFGNPDAAVRTAGIEALDAIAQRADFGKYFGNGSSRFTAEFAGYFKQAIQSGDVGMIATAAIALRNPKRNFATVFENFEFLEKAQSTLKLPSGIESWNELQRSIDFFKGNPNPTLQKPAFTHPINWAIIDEFTIEPTALIRTSKGNIRIRLLMTEAPGTVANFIALARDKFYDGKVFHRVVPNFVIQGGCPRGDGYGAPDYAIRSELPPRSWNQEGLVGMASAGNHTEGSQFFITHSPTLHLDGNYTIFAQVIEGMAIVHQIQPGSKIESIIIQ